MTNTNPIPSNSPETVVELGRMSSLSDSIFAFALTLLVLDIRLPDTTSAYDLPTQLIALGPKLLIYLISFVVIGGAWGSHQRMLSQIKRGDGLLVWFNLLSLLFVIFLPASSALLGKFPSEFLAVLCFAIDVILIQLSALWLWRHASKHSLISAAIDPRVVIAIGRRLSIGAVAFTLSVALAFININLVYIVWIALFAALFATDWLSWEQTLKKAESAIALDGAVHGQLDIVHSIGYLNILADAPASVLAEGIFGGGLDSRINRSGDLLEAHWVAPKRLGFMSYRYPWAWGPVSTMDWNLRLNPHIPLKLNIETGADQVDIVLTDAQITELEIETSGSSIDLRLPASAGQTSVHILASGAYLLIRVPTEVAARIYATNTISNIEIDLNRFSLAESGKEYISSDYETAANRVEIRLEQTVSFVKLI